MTPLPRAGISLTGRTRIIGIDSENSSIGALNSRFESHRLNILNQPSAYVYLLQFFDMSVYMAIWRLEF